MNLTYFVITYIDYSNNEKNKNYSKNILIINLSNKTYGSIIHGLVKHKLSNKHICWLSK